MSKTVFSVIGGDERFHILAKLFAAEGFTTFTAGFDSYPGNSEGVIKTDAVTAAAMADVIILPLPASTDGVAVNAPFSKRIVRFDSELIEAFGHSRIYTGFSEKLRRQQSALEKIILYDYSIRESFLIKNAYATAEAIIMLAMENSRKILPETKILITGCGRIGKYTAILLDRLGSDVYIASRSAENTAFISSFGIRTTGYEKLLPIINTFDIIINTADAMVINESVISEMKSDAVIIDAASYPGGTDFDAAARFGVKAIHALGLPGKYTPETAAKIIFDTITVMEGENKT